ncbi:hypothetical protein PUNSTDRAFT_143049 [Punctularia strigosozonata HHB-11173 SS5]|uniref:uncharacterized protein n=1 Tax=Punctularia strigosozonata (strain HHB-11173) TaxID=741275 RepID=UPI0004417DB0|nr:uncharacterized protein PUNSTDRAFT_143049 [Punctularia strigosozonata HHB-11173 SS5]EIN09503.1 hypothetical protein PUNSTDRAFT_143049 [Punctularia strigosozonata HHB-11173 SS5]
MHPALLVDEILRQIIEFCYSSAERKADATRTLARLARTCRAWRDPALDRLWWRLDCVAPLLALTRLARDQLFEEHLLQYGRRVKHLTLARLGSQLTSDLGNFLFTTAETSLGQNLLPNLGNLTIHKDAWSYTSKLMPFIISRALHTIDLHTSSQASLSVFHDFVETIRRVSSPIDTAVLRGPFNSEIQSLLTSLSSIRIYHSKRNQSLRASEIFALSRLPLLAELHIDGCSLNVDEVMACIEAQPIHAPSFPALESLHLSAPSALIEHILEASSSSTLRTVYLDIQDRALTTAPWRTIFSILGKKAAGTLQNLTATHFVDADESDLAAGPVPVEMTFTVNDLRDLRTVKSLRSFTLQSSFPTDLCDDDMDAIAQWWPNIEHLAVETGHIAMEGHSASHRECKHPSLTLGCLTSWARSCPQLDYLVLPRMDVGVGCPNPTQPFAPHNALRSLSIAIDEAMNETEQAAEYLHALFPCLAALGAVDDDAKWEGMRRALQRRSPATTFVPL